MSKDFDKHSPLNPDTWSDSLNQALLQRTSGQKAQAKAIGKPIDDLSAITSSNPDITFISPEIAESDTLVNTTRALVGWREEFAEYSMAVSAEVVQTSSHAALIRNPEHYTDTFNLVFDDKFID